MLSDRIKKWNSSFFGRAIYILLLVSFAAFFGISDIFRGKSNLSVVAKIGNLEITSVELMRAIDEYVIGNNINKEDILNRYIPNKVLHKLVIEKILDLEANRLGLVVSDEVVLKLIKNSPLFHDKNGNFDAQLFAKMLRRMHFYEKQYLEHLRKQIKRSQLLSAISAQITVPEEGNKLITNAYFAKRFCAYKLLKYADFRVQEQPKKEELHSLFVKNHDYLFSPDSKKISFIILNRKEVRKPDYEGNKGNRDVSNISNNLNATQHDIADVSNASHTLPNTPVVANTVNFSNISEAIEDDLAAGSDIEEIGKKYDISVMHVQAESQTFADKIFADQAFVDKAGFYSAQGYNLTFSDNVSVENKTLLAAAIRDGVKDFASQKQGDYFSYATKGYGAIGYSTKDDLLVFIKIDSHTERKHLTFEQATPLLERMWSRQQQRVLAHAAAKKLGGEIMRLQGTTFKALSLNDIINDKIPLADKAKVDNEKGGVADDNSAIGNDKGKARNKTNDETDNESNGRAKNGVSSKVNGKVSARVSGAEVKIPVEILDTIVSTPAGATNVVDSADGTGCYAVYIAQVDYNFVEHGNKLKLDLAEQFVSDAVEAYVEAIGRRYEKQEYEKTFAYVCEQYRVERKSSAL